MENNKDFFHYYDKEKNEFQICIRNNNGVDFSFIKNKKYQNIFYEGLKRTQLLEKNIEGDFHHIIFKCSEFVNKEILNNFFQKNNYCKIKNEAIFLKEFIEYFKQIENLTISKNEKFLGDLGEALFVLNLINKGYLEEITYALNKKDDEDVYDFSFKNFSIEVKTTTMNCSEIKISNDQFENCKNPNLDFVVIKTKIIKSKNNDNYINIFDLYKGEVHFMCPL